MYMYTLTYRMVVCPSYLDKAVKKKKKEYSEPVVVVFHPFHH